ncbi:hypothetical protein EYA84_28135 [Verrucosispora sp. SN26_14.1]|uniref:hypothetical protein n=1 Tax=Verrucosispora sp. SN26_14.1 TaxID=2527879 RepID=UPI00103419D3|nr:hypothetical protein [Verrucosispora sp. SN26_14.1]TBL27792.1 hypothetical protein EYA84_28135 [Verrucosispora sp. SN26_14.1]
MTRTPPITARLRIMLAVGLSAVLASAVADAPATAAPTTTARSGAHAAVADSGSVPSSTLSASVQRGVDGSRGGGVTGAAGSLSLIQL